MLYFKTILTPETLQSIVDLIPLNGWTGKIRTKAPVRDVYFQFYQCA
jgi:hypothetical protein